MFHRMFGRRKSPAEEEEETGEAVEATEEKPEGVNSDGFVVIGDNSNNLNNGYDPPPGYTVGGANAFLPYGIEPPRSTSNTTQRSASLDVMAAIDGIPFKFGSNVLLEDMVPTSPISTEEMMTKIKSFNWDDYEYSFKLERSILKEFTSSEYNQG